MSKRKQWDFISSVAHKWNKPNNQTNKKTTVGLNLISFAPLGPAKAALKQE